MLKVNKWISVLAATSVLASSLSVVQAAQKTTLASIEKDYPGAKILKVIHDGSRYILIDYQYNPRMANHFDLYDLDTGEKYGLPLGAWYTNLEQITSQNDIVFDANGVNGEGAQNVFPFTIVSTRENTNSQFGATLYPQYEDVSHSFTFVNGKTEELTSYGFSKDGITFQFGPLKNDPHDGFYAGSTWIPTTHISYNPQKNQLTIQFAKTLISPNFSVTNDPASYINSVHMQGSQTGGTSVVLQLKPGTQYYNANATWKDSHLNVPELQLSFLPKNVSFKPGEVIFHEANGKTLNQPLTPIASYPPASNTGISTTSTQSVAQWKSYVNQRFGFLIQYPFTWKMGPTPSDGDGRYFTAPSGVSSFDNGYGSGVPKTDVLLLAVGVTNAITGTGNFNQMVAAFKKNLPVERKQRGFISESYTVSPNKWILDSVIQKTGRGGFEYSEQYISLSAVLTYSLTVPQSESRKYAGIWNHIKTTFVPDYLHTSDGIDSISAQLTSSNASSVLSKTDMRVGKLLAEIQKQYSEPNVKTTVHGNGDPRWEYNKLGFAVDGNPIRQIEVSNSKVGSTPRGIHVGSSEQSVRSSKVYLKKIVTTSSGWDAHEPKR